MNKTVPGPISSLSTMCGLSSRMKRSSHFTLMVCRVSPSSATYSSAQPPPSLRRRASLPTAKMAWRMNSTVSNLMVAYHSTALTDEEMSLQIDLSLSPFSVYMYAMRPATGGLGQDFTVKACEDCRRWRSWSLAASTPRVRPKRELNGSSVNITSCSSKSHLLNVSNCVGCDVFFEGLETFLHCIYY